MRWDETDLLSENLFSNIDIHPTSTSSVGFLISEPKWILQLFYLHKSYMNTSRSHSFPFPEKSVPDRFFSPNVLIS
jgi:hypothetical protein